VGTVAGANHPKISCDDNKPIRQHKLSDSQCGNEPKTKFKDDDFLMFHMCLPDTKHPHRQRKVTVMQTCLKAFSMIKLNTSVQQKLLKKVLWLTTNTSPYFKCLASKMQATLWLCSDVMFEFLMNSLICLYMNFYFFKYKFL
jgi:hypothetical protein